MASTSKIAEELGWEIEKRSAYGNYKGFQVTLNQNITFARENYRALYIPVEGLNQVSVNNLKDYFKENKKELGVSLVKFSQDVVFIRLLETFKAFNSEKLENLLKNVISVFEKYGVTPFTKCVFCNKEDPNTKTKINGIIYPAHEECVSVAKTKIASEKQDYDKQSNNYIRGIIGALAGAIIGAIPWVLLEVFANLFASILAILIGYSAYAFYKIVGGKVTKATKYIILVMTIIGILFSNLVIAGYIILTNDAPITLHNLGIVYTDPDLSAYMWRDLGVALLIGAFGLFTIFRKVKSEEFNKSID